MGPFEDEDEWQLAKRLIQNIGQKQTDVFLKLPIVSFFLAVFMDILMIQLNRLKNVHNSHIVIIRTS